jgi:hypothetical protein
VAWKFLELIIQIGEAFQPTVKGGIDFPMERSPTKADAEVLG